MWTLLISKKENVHTISLIIFAKKMHSYSPLFDDVLYDFHIRRRKRKVRIAICLVIFVFIFVFSTLAWYCHAHPKIRKCFSFEKFQRNISKSKKKEEWPNKLFLKCYSNWPQKTKFHNEIKKNYFFFNFPCRSDDWKFCRPILHIWDCLSCVFCWFRYIRSR